MTYIARGVQTNQARRWVVGEFVVVVAEVVFVVVAKVVVVVAKIFVYPSSTPRRVC